MFAHIIQREEELWVKKKIKSIKLERLVVYIGVVTNLNVAWIHVTAFKRFVSRSTHCWKHVVEHVWLAICGNAVLHWLLIVILLLLLLSSSSSSSSPPPPHLIVVLEYCLRVLMFWRQYFEGTYLVFLQGQAAFRCTLKIEALCSFEMLETVYQSRQRTSQKTWILIIFSLYLINKDPGSLQTSYKPTFGTTVPEGVERYLYPAHCGALLGSWANRSAWKWNRR